MAFDNDESDVIPVSASNDSFESERDYPGNGITVFGTTSNKSASADSFLQQN